MLLPNKTISYSDSVLAHFPAVLDFLKEKDWNVLELYKKLKKKNHNYNIQNYIETLDCLFALGKIEFNELTGEIKLCLQK